MTLAGIIFDLDGTLGETVPVVNIAMRGMFEQFTGRTYSDAEIAEMFGPTEDGIIRKRIGERDFQAALDDFLARYEENHAICSAPFPGVIEMLTLLRERGIRRAIVTGKGGGSAAISMRVLGLEPYVEMLLYGSDDGAEKDAAMRRVLDAWGMRPEQAAYVGDVPYDMVAARAAGLLPLGAGWSVGATVHDGPDGAARVFRSPAELCSWLEDKELI